MADDSYDAIMTTPRPRGPLLIPLIGLLLAVAAGPVMVVALNNGASAALNGGGNGAGWFIVLFFVGLAMALAGVVLGIIGIRRGGHPVLSAFSIVAGVLP